MAAPFLIVALGSNRPGGTRTLGHATVAFFAAGTVANLLWGFLADRSGFRAVFLTGALVWIGALAWALEAPPTTSVVALFLLVGAAQSGLQMASVNLVYEFSERGELGVRIAVVNAVGELFGAIAPLAGGLIADRWSYAALYCTAVLFTALAVAGMLFGVRPRHRRREMAA
jgi:MFS family permease